MDNSKIEPLLQVTKIGWHGFFICSTFGQINWHKDGYNIPDDVIVIPERNQLSIPSAKLKHAGEYSCYGKYTDSPKHFIATGTLKVVGK